MSAPASVPFLLRLGLVSVFVSAVRVPGAPLEEALRGKQNTTWATSFPIFLLATQAPGVENNPHSQRPGSAAAGLEKLVLEREGRGEEAPEAPRPWSGSHSHWPCGPQPPKAVTWRFCLWDSGSGQGHLSQDQLQGLIAPGSVGEGAGEGEGRKGLKAKGPSGSGTSSYLVAGLGHLPAGF